MARYRPPRVQGIEHSLTQGCAESPEEKAAMRRQIAAAMALAPTPPVTVLPPQPTPLRAEARPIDPKDARTRRRGGLSEERDAGLSNDAT